MTEVFLPPPGPPRFDPLDPDLPLRIYQRRLPHWRQPGATYFVTFRLGDSLPQAKLRQLSQIRSGWLRRNPEPRDESQWQHLAREIAQNAEKWLDEGAGSCLLRDPRAAEELAKAMRQHQHVRYFLACYCVMPNHCHAVVRPFGGEELERVLARWKGQAAVAINRHRRRSGTIWEQESYDRIIRDAAHLFRVVQYIGANPHKANIPRKEWVRWIDPEWEQAGWNFRDVTNDSH